MDGDAFVDYLRALFCEKNDAALAKSLGVRPPLISKVRRGRMPVSDYLIVKILERKPEISISELRYVIDRYKYQ